MSSGAPRPESVPSRRVTDLLLSWGAGDESALSHLVPLVFDELRRLAHRHMRSQRDGHVLQTTALVNEVYVRLIDLSRVKWHNRGHFMAMASRLMRRVLIDFARASAAAKRGGTTVFVTLDESVVGPGGPGADLVALDDALEALAKIEPRRSQVVEMKFFGGLTIDETADVLGISPQTVLRDWRLAKVWLLRELTREAGNG
jgi:RNA polymerase sigma-70 factor, ECF subfamily